MPMSDPAALSDKHVAMIRLDFTSPPARDRRGFLSWPTAGGPSAANPSAGDQSQPCITVHQPIPHLITRSIILNPTTR